MRTQPEGAPVLPSAELPPKELQRRKAEAAPQDQPVYRRHQDERHHRRKQEGIRVPQRHIGGQAVTVVIHPGGHVLEHRVAQDISDDGADNRHQQRHRHIVPDKFPPGIAGSPQRADDAGLSGNGVGDRNGHDESHNHDDDIQQDHHHDPVAAHVVPGEHDGLVQMPRYEIPKFDLPGQLLHQLFGHVVGLPVVLRRHRILPGVDEMHLLSVISFELLRRDQRYAKLDGVEHRVAVVREERAVIRQGNQPRHRPAVQVALQAVADREAVVFGVHPVNGNLARCLRHPSLHQAGAVDLGPLRKEPHGGAVVQRLIHIIEVVDLDPQRVDRLALGAV